MKNSKKILIVTSEFPPQPGGIGNHSYNLANQLQLNNYSVTVLTDVRSKTAVEEQQFDEKLPFKVIRIKRYKFLVVTYLKRILVYRQSLANSTIILATGKFSLWMVGLDPFLKKRKKFAVIHGTEVNFSGILKKITNKALLRFHKVIAVSHFTKSLVALLKLENIEVIPNGFNNLVVENKISSDYSIQKRFPALITVGNVSERKGQLNMIKALPELIKTHPNCVYNIVGIPTLQNELEKVAEELGVGKCIVFHGMVSEARKASILKESDIFVMLSNKTETGDVEGFGIAILEANAFGLPAIGSNTSGIVDAIKHNWSGKLVHPSDTNDILKGIDQILASYGEYSSQAKEWARLFEWNLIIKKYLKAFE